MGIWGWFKRVVGDTPSDSAVVARKETAADTSERPKAGRHSTRSAVRPPATSVVNRELPAITRSVPPAPAPPPSAKTVPTARAPIARSLSPDLTQFPGAVRGAATDVVLGFDFGTSSAKVACQTPYALGGRRVLIDFGTLGHSACSYLLPVSMYRDASDVWHLTRPIQPSEHRRHLKLPLMGEIRNGETPADETIEWAVAFAALALRAARRVFLESQSDTYGTLRLTWAMNVGIPSAGYDDERIRSRFAHVSRAAWLVSLSERVDRAAVRRAIADTKNERQLDIPIAVVPEVAAEMVGYARSRFRRPGLHTVVDIGASTLDICGIELFADDGEDRYELLTADVRDLGFLELHQRRAKIASGAPPFDVLPADIVGPLPRPSEAPQELRVPLDECDRQYIEEAARVLIRTLAWLHRTRAPGSPAWKQGLPLFLTGGGADSHVSRWIWQRAHEQARSMWVNYAGLVVQPLPMEVAVGPTAAGQTAYLQRLVVAYGLSFPEISIGTIVPPSDIATPEPIDLPRREWQRAYIEK